MTKSVWGDLLFLVVCLLSADLFNNYVVEEEPLALKELFSVGRVVSLAVGIAIGLMIGHYFRKNRIKKN
ncbi:MAG: hypothetical protein ACSHWW_06530 [Nonlabens sp.]|uniref:hypothetical protein n=1 Tax=Nonlabens sp. TaxID=1888209 RepID=UPI003EF6F5D8